MYFSAETNLGSNGRNISNGSSSIFLLVNCFISLSYFLLRIVWFGDSAAFNISDQDTDCAFCWSMDWCRQPVAHRTWKKTLAMVHVLGWFIHGKDDFT